MNVNSLPFWHNLMECGYQFVYHVPPSILLTDVDALAFHISGFLQQEEMIFNLRDLESKYR